MAPACVGLRKDVEHIRLKTNGGGACALHSVFGLPSMDEENGIEFFASDARPKLVRTLGATAQEFQHRLNTEWFLTNIVTELWGDGLRPILLQECKQPGAGETRATARILWDSVRKDAVFRQRLINTRNERERISQSENARLLRGVLHTSFS